MFEDFSVDRAASVVVLALLPAFTGCADMIRNPQSGKVSSQPIVAQNAVQPSVRTQRIAYPAEDLRQIKLMAVANDRSNLTTDVVSLKNCEKTAEAFTNLKGSFGGSVQVYASCLPKDGGTPIASYACSKKGKTASCELVR